ncbi:MAG: two-component sensor histidine kinase [Stappia sp.]|uniref:ATP-binding protein n=1 Tax=Stappia sp. TaxID=1870903 RepID=UPI000C420601|nr:ATP-binding protein [Stappia sp.]MAA97908.1 two-component sensor histidine kinase [Stappia sp.]MBM19678.1 two-component sensor histidine kinase [Stappia sp.]
MSDETTAAGRPDQRRLRPDLRERIVTQRWVLGAALILAVVAHRSGAVPVWAALGGFALLVVAALFAPQRRKAVIRRMREARAVTPWPDTGMKRIAEALHDPCFIVDHRGITRYVNRAAQQRFGDPHPGDPVSFRLRSPAVVEALDKVIAHGEPQRIEWSEKAPTEQWLEAQIAPIGDMAGETVMQAGPRFILVTVRDLTEQRRLERMRADFVANASHELRTPLASLTGFAETLLGPAREDPVARERFLAIMLQQGERMRRLIDDLLSLSRIEMKAHVQPETVIDLVPILRQTRDALKPVADELGVVMTIEAPESPCLVRGDRDELIEVVENLAENAVKYGASGGRVEMKLSVAEDERSGAPSRPGMLCLSVRDHGPGIAPEHLPRLTERFYRADVATSREMKGTGLGLAIVKHILTRHRARLEIDSRLGEGAVFTVKIPLAETGDKMPAPDID